MGTKRIVIIGAGLSGLSSAALLAKKGFEVTVIDKHDTPGGVARSFEEKGFSFDMGPSWYLMPEVFERFFAEFGKKPSDYYDLICLDPSYKVFFGVNDSLTIRRNRESTFQLFENIEAGAGERMREYLQDAQHKYDTAMAEFLYREYNSILDFFNMKMLLGGVKLDLFRNLDRFVRRHFKSEKIRKILEYNIVFLGCSPFKSPALYSLMSHVDITSGVYYPMGGVHKLVKAMYHVAKEHGTEFMLGQEVKSIRIEEGKATGVETEKQTINADIVLATIDYHHAETELIAPQYQDYPESYWNKRVLAPSAFLVYLGLSKNVPGLEHHNLFLSQDWEQHFTAIFSKPSWPENPSYYIGCPSKTDTSIAPNNGESLFIFVPVAPGLDDTETIREQFSHKILEHVEELLGVKITDAITVRRVIAQQDFKNANNLYKGTAMGMAHTLFQSAVFRPSHRSKKVPNLFFSSHYTHPGIGMPMVVISGHIVTNIITKHFS